MDPKDKSPLVAALLQPLVPEAEGQNDLGDERVVLLLVRGYVDICLAQFQAALDGSLSQDDAAETMYNQAQALNAVFLGQSGLPTVTTHGWNDPDQLGAFLRDTLELDYPADECVRVLLVHMATQIMTTLQGAQQDWQQQVDAMVAEVRDLLLGRLPADGAAPPYA